MTYSTSIFLWGCFCGSVAGAILGFFLGAIMAASGRASEEEDEMYGDVVNVERAK